MDKRFLKGKLHPNWRGGWKNKLPNCLICNKKLTNYDAKYCQKHLHSGKRCHLYIDGRSLKKYYCKVCKKEIYRGSTYCKSCENKRRWRNIEFKEKMIKKIAKAVNIYPNKIELKLYKILQKMNLKMFILNVQIKKIIGGKIPDFIDKKNKRIIEVFGDYWHSNKHIKKFGTFVDTEKGRKLYFKNFGYKTLIIWEHELKNIKNVKQKIRGFINE